MSAELKIALWTVGCAVFVTVTGEIEVALAETEAVEAAAAVLVQICDVTTVPMLVEEAATELTPEGGGGGALEATGVLLTGGCCFFLRESCEGTEQE